MKVNHSAAYRHLLNNTSPRRYAVRLLGRVVRIAVLGGALLAGLAPTWVRAGEQDSGTVVALADVVVTGHYDNAVGTSDAASQGVITSKLLKSRPPSRPGEVLEFVPGVIVTQHSGDGKANQYFLRGFNLDHGTDFSTWVAGVPVNLPTHAHGHGYTDLNFLIPELIDRIEYQKGPYFAANGDFSSAGSASISLRNTMARPVAQLTLGQRGYQRLFSAASTAVGSNANLLAALDVAGYDGPWTNPQDLRRQNILLRYSEGSRSNGLDLTFSSYRGRWNATDQVPQRAIDSGLIGRFDAIDPSNGGRTERDALSAHWRRKLDDGSLEVSAYLLRYSLSLYSNFTYFLDREDDGDQFLQRDRRTVYGAHLKRFWIGNLGGYTTHVSAGLQTRHDRIAVGLFDSVQRSVTNTVRDDRVGQTSVGVFAEADVHLRTWLRAIAGLRADRYTWDVSGAVPENSGRTSESLVSPKFSLVLGPWAKTEYFVNWGRGFHSNDGRGTVTRIDPRSGDAVSPVNGLVRTTGYELGVRSQWLPNLQSSLALWRLALGSELLFVGDAGTTEASRASVRQGIEWSNRYTPAPWLLFDLDLAWSKARFAAEEGAGNFVPGSVSRVASAAVTVRDLGPWSVSLQLRHLGPRPLVEDNSVRASASTLTNLRITYRVNRSLDLGLDMFNVLSRRANDIEYFYPSRLRGEAAPVNDRHVHPVEPRALRFSAKLTF